LRKARRAKEEHARRIKSAGQCACHYSGSVAALSERCVCLGNIDRSAVRDRRYSYSNEEFFHILWRGKTDVDRRIWCLRIHDYGLGRLHIYELVLICSMGFKENSYDFFLTSVGTITDCADDTDSKRPK
jgi:hypothetical protein